MIEINGRSYRRPDIPRAIICLDGSDPEYIDDALAHAKTPALARWRREGTFVVGRAAMPTFTNPNNISIVTGVPPSVHGISGNHFYDRAANVDVPMNKKSYLRVPTILDALAEEGVRILSVTAKHKLVDLIAAGKEAISAEKTAGLDVYSPEASLWVLDAGAEALEKRTADLVYLSTTDYVQHKHAPGSAEARAFYEAIDARLARLEKSGAVVALTADHGMNDKTRADGTPNVVYLSSVLDRALGPGTRVTLPITDPYVVHHGALGSCAMVYTLGHDLERARNLLAEQPGVEAVLARDEAASRWALPPDRIGDLVVVSGERVVLGKRPEDHDLSHVKSGLRSHGGLHEAEVPILCSRPSSRAPLHNLDVFDLALNIS